MHAAHITPCPSPPHPPNTGVTLPTHFPPAGWQPRGDRRTAGAAVRVAAERVRGDESEDDEAKKERDLLEDDEEVATCGGVGRMRETGKRVPQGWREGTGSLRSRA